MSVPDKTDYNKFIEGINEDKRVSFHAALAQGITEYRDKTRYEGELIPKQVIGPVEGRVHAQYIRSDNGEIVTIETDEIF